MNLISVLTYINYFQLQNSNAKPDKAEKKEDKKKEEPAKKSKSKFSLFGMNKDKETSEEKAKKKEAAIQRKNMAKGVGYSSYQQKGWDVKAYLAAQKEKDKQIELVLGKIYHELRKLHVNQNMGSRNLPDLVDGMSTSNYLIFVKNFVKLQHEIITQHCFCLYRYRFWYI